MTIYQTRPSPDVLIAFGFQRYPGSRLIRLHFEDAVATYQDFQNPDTNASGPLMNLTLSVLWTMLRAEQDLWLKQHPQGQVTFV